MREHDWAGLLYLTGFAALIWSLPWLIARDVRKWSGLEARWRRADYVWSDERSDVMSEHADKGNGTHGHKGSVNSQFARQALAPLLKDGDLERMAECRKNYLEHLERKRTKKGGR